MKERSVVNRCRRSVFLVGFIYFPCPNAVNVLKLELVNEFMVYVLQLRPKLLLL